jgi:hypothetical protein
MASYPRFLIYLERLFSLLCAIVAAPLQLYHRATVGVVLHEAFNVPRAGRRVALLAVSPSPRHGRNKQQHPRATSCSCCRAGCWRCR